MVQIIEILKWPFTIIILFLIFRKEVSQSIKKISLKEISISEKIKLIFSRQYKVVKENKDNENSFFEELYSKMTGAQLRFLFILRESMKLGGKGLDCGYVSNYFQNIIRSKTDRYDGWITPFITAYLQENGLVSVADNFFRLNKIGEEFLNYIETKGHKRSKKEL
jgi:hypothetical protein